MSLEFSLTSKPLVNRRMVLLLRSSPGSRSQSPLTTDHTMKFLLAIAIAILVAASIFADYKWRKWIADRRRERQ